MWDNTYVESNDVYHFLVFRHVPYGPDSCHFVAHAVNVSFLNVVNRGC